MSAQLTIRPPPHVDYVQGFPGVSASSSSPFPSSSAPQKQRPQAHLAGTVELRSPKGIKMSWLRIELKKIEVLPNTNNSQGGRQTELIGNGPNVLWRKRDGVEYELVMNRDFNFKIPIPEALPPSIAIDNKGSGVSYELVASMCTKPKKSLLSTSSKPPILLQNVPIVLEKHDLQCAWPIYRPNPPEARTTTLQEEGGPVTMTVERKLTCYGPGDSVWVRVKIMGDRIRPFKLQKIELVVTETITFRPLPSANKGRAEGPAEQRTSLIVDSRVPVNKTLYRQETFIADVRGTVPASHSRVTVRTARHIQVAYQLKVRAVLDGFEGPGGKQREIQVDHLPTTMSGWPFRQGANLLEKIGWDEKLCDGRPLPVGRPEGRDGYDEAGLPPAASSHQVGDTPRNPQGSGQLSNGYGGPGSSSGSSGHHHGGFANQARPGTANSAGTGTGVGQQMNGSSSVASPTISGDTGLPIQTGINGTITYTANQQYGRQQQQQQQQQQPQPEVQRHQDLQRQQPQQTPSQHPYGFQNGVNGSQNPNPTMQPQQNGIGQSGHVASPSQSHQYGGAAAGYRPGQQGGQPQFPHPFSAQQQNELESGSSTALQQVVPGPAPSGSTSVQQSSSSDVKESVALAKAKAAGFETNPSSGQQGPAGFRVANPDDSQPGPAAWESAEAEKRRLKENSLRAEAEQRAAQERQQQMLQGGDVGRMASPPPAQPQQMQSQMNGMQGMAQAGYPSTSAFQQPSQGMGTASGSSGPSQALAYPTADSEKASLQRYHEARENSERFREGSPDQGAQPPQQEQTTQIPINNPVMPTSEPQSLYGRHTQQEPAAMGLPNEMSEERRRFLAAVSQRDGVPQDQQPVANTGYKSAEQEKELLRQQLAKSEVTPQVSNTMYQSQQQQVPQQPAPVSSPQPQIVAPQPLGPALSPIQNQTPAPPAPSGPHFNEKSELEAFYRARDAVQTEEGAASSSAAPPPEQPQPQPQPQLQQPQPSTFQPVPALSEKAQLERYLRAKEAAEGQAPNEAQEAAPAASYSTPIQQAQPAPQQTPAPSGSRLESKAELAAFYAARDAASQVDQYDGASGSGINQNQQQFSGTPSMQSPQRTLSMSSRHTPEPSRQMIQQPDRSNTVSPSMQQSQQMMPQGFFPGQMQNGFQPFPGFQGQMQMQPQQMQQLQPQIQPQQMQPQMGFQPQQQQQQQQPGFQQFPQQMMYPQMGMMPQMGFSQPQQQGMPQQMQSPTQPQQQSLHPSPQMNASQSSTDSTSGPNLGHAPYPTASQGSGFNYGYMPNVQPNMQYNPYNSWQSMQGGFQQSFPGQQPNMQAPTSPAGGYHQGLGMTMGSPAPGGNPQM